MDSAPFRETRPSLIRFQIHVLNSLGTPGISGSESISTCTSVSDPYMIVSNVVRLVFSNVSWIVVINLLNFLSVS
jgi:hypothetical protein